MRVVVHDLVGPSAATQEVVAFIGKVADTRATVLIRGESGTGKEVVARAIHRNSLRSEGPFGALNCGAVPEALLESELFGFEKGAFTGAFEQRKGKIESAQGGTLFLDEVGEMSPLMQVKLLRVLQEREFERVGGRKPIKADFRLIAATHRDLEKAVDTGDFRADLYYRLKVLTIKISALRERPEDILPLALHFVDKYAREYNRTIADISEGAEKILRRYEWPGNVRELEHAMEAAVVIGSGNVIHALDLPVDIVLSPPKALINALNGLKVIRQQVERFVIENALIWAEGQQKKAAQLLDISERTLFRYIQAMKLTPFLKGGV